MKELYERYDQPGFTYVHAGPRADQVEVTFRDVDRNVIVYGGFLWRALVDYDNDKLTLKPYEIPGIVDKAPGCKGLVRSDVFAGYSQYQLDKVNGDRSRLKISHSRSWCKTSWDFVVVDDLHPHVPICLEHRRIWPCPEHLDVHEMHRSLQRLETEANKRICGKCGREVDRAQMLVEIAAEPGFPVVWFHGRAGACRDTAFRMAAERGHLMPSKSAMGNRANQLWSVTSRPPLNEREKLK